jgi:hypothetical protein
VLAGLGDTAGRARAGGTEPVRHPDHRTPLAVAVGDLDDGAAAGDRRGGEHIPAVPDVSPGQPGPLQVALERVAVGMAGHPGGDDLRPGPQFRLERDVRIRVGDAEEVLQLAP